MEFPKNYTLETERCCLRFVSRDDIPHIFSAAQYPGFTDGMQWEPPECESDLVEHLESNVKSWEEDEAYCFTVEHDGDFVGRIAVRKQDEEGKWDLGFWTHPEKQGRGFMTEVVAAVIRFGFEKLRANNIIADHALWNVASEKVLKNNGMKFLRYAPQGFQKRGEWVKKNVLGITAEEWLAVSCEQEAPAIYNSIGNGSYKISRI